MSATAEDLINDARNYASQQLSNAASEMNAAMTILDGLSSQGAGKLDFNMTVPVVREIGNAPQFGGSVFHDPGLKAKEPVFTDPGTLDTSGEPGAAPPLAKFEPPSKPEGEPEDTTGDGPIVNYPASVPDPPDMMAQIASIPVPHIIPIGEVPPPPPYHPPEFIVQPIDPAPLPPTDLEDTLRNAYADISPIMIQAVTAQIDAFIDHEFPNHRVGLAKIEDRLNKYLDGGSALSPAIENAIYNRTLDKTNTEYMRASRKSWNDAGRMGFTLPNPILVAQQYDLDQARRDANARAATDIAIEQAKLEQANLQFAVTQSSMLRKLAIDSALSYYNGLVQINGQALEYARGLMDAIIKAYDIAAKHSEIQVRIYEAYVRVYEAQLKGSMAELEAYALQLKAIETKTQVDLAQVQLYTAQIGAIDAEATVYRAQIDGIKAQAEIEQMKVQLYTAQVGAYVAKMNGFTARWQGYSAAVGGESAKMQASGIEQQAWAAQAGVYEAKIRGRTAALQGQLSVNEGNIKTYQAAVEAYSAHVRALAEISRAEVESFDTTIKAFQAQANAISEHARAQIASYEAGLRAANAASDVILTNLHEANAIEMAKIAGIARVATAAGSIFSGTAQASLSGMNSLASVAAQEGS